MGIGMMIPHVIFLLLLLGSGDFQVDGLTVIGKDDPVEALRGEDVTIPCLLSDVPKPLDLHKVSVVWTHRSENGTEYKIYRFQGFQHESFRPGSHMNDKDLVQGKASLSIPNIQIRDDGEYICFVIVTPNAGYTKSTLHVSVKPQIELTYMRAIQFGYEGSVFCKVSNFYPEDVKIRWDKYSKSTDTKSRLDKDVSSTLPVRNNDGTFSVTSVLIVKIYREVDPEDVISCVVTHRSLKEETAVSFAMPGLRPLRNVAIAIVPFLLILLLTLYLKIFKKGWRPWTDVFHCAIMISIILLTCFLLYFMVDLGGMKLWEYILLPLIIILFLIILSHSGTSLWRYFKNGDLIVFEISGNEYIPHMERTTLTCQIRDFRPKEIQINVYLKRCNEIKKSPIASWESTDRTPSNNSSTAKGQRTNNSNALSTLERGAEHVTMESEITRSFTGLYNCRCSIYITPSVDKDDRAILAVEVEHVTIKQPISVWRTLNVRNGKKWLHCIPKLSAITGDRWIHHKKKTTLSCQITGFRRKKIHINLYLKRRNDIAKHLICSWVSVKRLPGEGNIKAGRQSGENIEAEPLLGDDVSDTMIPVEMEAVMTTQNGYYTCTCTISLTPDADTDDGAVLTVEVDHAALEWPICKYRILNVIKGNKPSLWSRKDGTDQICNI